MENSTKMKCKSHQHFSNIFVDLFPDTSSIETLVIITHHHQDHMTGKISKFKGTIITSEITKTLIKHKVKSPIISIPYLEWFTPPSQPDVHIQLIPNYHCAGSVGIVLRKENFSIGFTGDFRIWEQTDSAVSSFMQFFQQCHTLYYDDTFAYEQSYDIPSLASIQSELLQRINLCKTIFMDINRTGIEILLKPLLQNPTINYVFHDSLSAPMNTILPLLFKTCKTSHKTIIFGRYNKLQSFPKDIDLFIKPRCTSAFLCQSMKPVAKPNQLYEPVLCFHNSPDELRYFLARARPLLSSCQFVIPLYSPVIMKK
jgi:hypothetical protein